MIVTLTGIVVFGVELFGDPRPTRTGNPAKFRPQPAYVLIPLLLLAADAQTPSVQPPLLTGRTSALVRMDTAS